MNTHLNNWVLKWPPHPWIGKENAEPGIFLLTPEFLGSPTAFRPFWGVHYAQKNLREQMKQNCRQNSGLPGWCISKYAHELYTLNRWYNWLRERQKRGCSGDASIPGCIGFCHGLFIVWNPQHKLCSSEMGNQWPRYRFPFRMEEQTMSFKKRSIS